MPERNGLCVYLKPSVSLAETNKMKRRLAEGRWRRRHGCGATIDLVSALSSYRGTSSQI
jgi:hypothetical protein